MEWEIIAPLIMTVVLILTVGGVLILRPIASRLGDLVEALQQGKSDPAIAQSLQQMTGLLEAQNDRLERLEERQQFTDELLRSGGSSGARISAPRELSQGADADG